MKSSIEDDFREVSPYLDEVLEMEMDARQGWLDDLETRAPAIAERVKSYLHEIARLDREHFMESPAGRSPAIPTLRGQRFGHYTLLRPLGHGGMGTVWLANRNEGPFKGEAAVKLLNASLIGHPAEQRFLREGNVLAKLRHPNIAQLLDAGVGAGGQPYLILEYVRGDRIDHFCEKHNFDIEQRIALFLGVLAAVAHAHSKLIVHRDLKPENILVSEDGTVKLLDFGVAALLSSAADESAPLTHLVPPGLTPGYAAPEQFLHEQATTATDVYALGLVLFVLLAGRHPLISGDWTAAELMRLTLERELPRPSQLATERRKQRLLGGDLDNIVSMAVRRNPAERYVSVDAFASDLRRYLALEPVSARPPSFVYRASKFVRRHRGAVVAALVVTLVLIGAVALTTSKMLEARDQRDRARFQTRRADAFTGLLKAMMQSDSGPNRARMSYFERADFGVQMVNKQYLTEDPQFAGEMLVQLAAMFRDSGELARAVSVYEQAYEVGRHSHSLEIMAYAQCNRAYGEAAAGVREGTLGRIKEGETLLERIGSDDSVLRAECLRAQARLEQDYGHYDHAVSLLSQAIRQVEAAGETHTLTYSAALGDLGQVYVASHQLRESLRIVERVAEIEDRNGRGGTAGRLVIRQNAAFLLAEMGEIRAALREREIIQLHLHDVESPGQEPFAYALNYASLLLRMERPADSMRALAGTLERATQQGNRLVQARALILEGSILAGLGRLDEAEAAARRASVIATDGLGNKDYQAQAQSLMTRVDLARGDLRSAQRHSVDALVLAGYHTKNPERSLASTLLLAALVDLSNRSFADAERLARDALAISESVMRGPDTSADVGEALLRLTQARIGAGSLTGATPLLERALRCLENGLGTAHPLTLEARKLLQSLPEQL